MCNEEKSKEIKINSENIEKTLNVPKVYFKDFYNVQPVHCDCVIGEFLLPWNGEIIKCYKDSNGPIPAYYPVVPDPYHYPGSVYLPIKCVEEGYFTEEDLQTYFEICEKKYQEKKAENEIAIQMASKAYELLKNKYHIVNAKYKETVIECEEYELRSYNSVYYIRKYKDSDMSKRFYWNLDKTFQEYKTENIDKAVDCFYSYIK